MSIFEDITSSPVAQKSRSSRGFASSTPAQFLC